MKSENKHLKIDGNDNSFEIYNVEIGGYFNKPTVNIGFDIEQTKSIVNELFEYNFPRLRLIAEEQAKLNIINFSNKLIESFSLHIHDSTKIISSPDFQFTLSKAIETAARFDNPNLHDLLVELITQKINYINCDTKSLIISECINVIGKLSLNQLNILTFSFMFLEYPHKLHFETWDEYNSYFDENVRPFMSFENNQIDFKHLEYVGCNRFDPGFGIPRLSTILKQQNPHLFTGTTDLHKDVSLSDKIAMDNFKDYIEIDKIIIKANIWGLSSTSVGILLASIFYEKIVSGKSIDINLFY